MTQITQEQIDHVFNLMQQTAEQVAAYLKGEENPKLKPADMSVFVGQPVLCEFWDDHDNNFTLGMLTRVDDNPSKNSRLRCQPKFGYWQSVRNFDDFCEFWDSVTNAGFEIERENYSFRITDYRDGFGPRWEDAK